MQFLLSIAVCLCLFIASAAAPCRATDDPPADAAALLAEARRVFYTHDLGKTRSLLERALAAAPDADELVEIEITLATLAWRYDGTPDAARIHLRAAESAGSRPSDAPAERARMETHLGNFDAARTAALQSLAAARSASERRRAAIAFATAVVGQALAAKLDGSTGMPGRKHILEALELVRPIVTAEPGTLVPSRLQVGLALLAGDGRAALQGWRSYFRLSPSSPPGSVLAKPSTELSALLPRWTIARTAATGRVVAALAASRFFDEAVLAAPTSHPTSLERQTLAYARFAWRARRITDEYYRLTALGRGDWDVCQARLFAEAAALWPEIRPEAATDFSPEAFGRVVDARFGALINIGETAGYRDLHMGHRVVDEEREVTQYGRRAKVRFVALDSLVSNGFQSWAWDGRAEHGGWASDNLIVQVRPAYADGPLDAWRAITDPDDRAERARRVSADSAGDDARAAANPSAYLPGLAGRLRTQGMERMLSGLRARGLAGESLRIAFLAAYEHAEIESTIFAHEGRHAIDKTLGESFTGADLEFRAKISQIVFAPEPRLALGGIIDANIGDSSPHGQANERVMKGLVAWMSAHAADVTALDRSRPLLPQFDRLTDDQIRAAFGSLDPMRPAEQSRHWPARRYAFQAGAPISSGTTPARKRTSVFVPSSASMSSVSNVPFVVSH